MSYSPIHEKPLLFEVFRDTHDASEEMVAEYERMYAAMTSDVNLEGQISDAEGKIELALKKKSKLLELTALGQITNEDFAAMTAACNEEIKSAEQELAELRSRRDDSEDFRRHMEKIRSTLRAAERQANVGAITKEFVDTFVDKIIATPIDDHTMRLDVKIFTGETTSRYLEKLSGRTGHTFKKMIEAYENGMK